MNTMSDDEINVGIDTGQELLDIYIRPTGDVLSVQNNPEGIRQAVRFIKRYKPTRILIEATGRLEMDFFCAAHQAGLPVCVCNPIQMRKFAQAIGRLAKTDQLDAQDIAYYGETMKPNPTELKPAKLRLLGDLLGFRSYWKDDYQNDRIKLAHPWHGIHACDVGKRRLFFLYSQQMPIGNGRTNTQGNRKRQTR